jgi:diguanylate cyclase
METREVADAIQAGRDARPRQTDPAARRGRSPTRVQKRPEESNERPSSGNTMIIDAMDARESILNKNIQEVRDLLLKLASAVGATQDASGEAATAFRNARDTMNKVDFTVSSELAEAHGILVREIDRVIRSNAKLHAELDTANQGIVEQRRQIEELRVQARIDALTRIPNRAAFDERLDEYIGLLERTSLIFTLMILDIDHFKAINDTHGHVNGDRILRGVAEKIASAVRGNDFAARYGGEEFAVIFPGTAQDEAMVVAERLRQDIAKTNFRLDGTNIKMTLSGGMAECHKGMSADQIIASADGALYQAKGAGRNQILGSDGADSRSVERL